MTPFRIMVVAAGLICSVVIGGYSGVIVGVAAAALTASIWLLPWLIQMWRNNRVPYYEAEGHMRVGNWSEAERWYKAIADVAKVSHMKADALANVARAQVKQKKFAEAEQTVLEALPLTKSGTVRGRLLSARGEAELGRGDHAAAIRSQLEALALVDATEPSTELAERHLQLGKAQAAAADAAAIPTLIKALEISKASSEEPTAQQASILQAIAEAMLTQGQGPEAVPYLEQAAQVLEATLTKDSPEFMVATEWLGRAYDAAGDHSKAVATFENAVALHERHVGKSTPEFITALMYLARHYLGQGLYAKSIELARNAYGQMGITRDPRSDEGLLLLAEIYERSGRGDEAVQFRKKLSTAPKEHTQRPWATSVADKAEAAS
jgi:tetratricopeptide (TPR) repeat protein